MVFTVQNLKEAEEFLTMCQSHKEVKSTMLNIPESTGDEGYSKVKLHAKYLKQITVK
jgi:phosphoribosyl-dephospho-CoA transferase